MDLEVRQQHQINILAVKYEGSWSRCPNLIIFFRYGETVLVMGSNKSLARFLRV